MNINSFLSLGQLETKNYTISGGQSQAEISDVFSMQTDISIGNEFTFMMTNNCNMTCKHCICSAKQGLSKFDKNKIIRIVNLLASTGVVSLNLTGGEIFLYLDELKDIFYEIGKNKIVINSIKTNMYLADSNGYEKKIFELFEKYFDGLLLAGVNIHDVREYVIHGLEVSIDRYHGGIEANISKLLKIIGINSKLVNRCNFWEKGFMCVNMIRTNSDIQDEKDIIKIINALVSAGYKVCILDNVQGKIFGINDICIYLKQGLQGNFIKIVIEKDGLQQYIRLGLLPIFGLGRAQNLTSNISSKLLKNFEQDISSFIQSGFPLKISAINFEGNVFLNEFFLYTNSFVLGNIDNGFGGVIQESRLNPILIEYQNYGLIRVLPILLKLIPDLEKYKYIGAFDVFAKILSMKNGYEILYKSCLLVQKITNKKVQLS